MIGNSQSFGRQHHQSPTNHYGQQGPVAPLPPPGNPVNQEPIVNHFNYEPRRRSQEQPPLEQRNVPQSSEFDPEVAMAAVTDKTKKKLDKDEIKTRAENTENA